MHNVHYTEIARQDLKRLEWKTAQRIIKKIIYFSRQKDPLVFAKRLSNFELGKFRFRVADYRIIFDIDHNGEIMILLILRIKHRKDVYNL